MEAKDADTKDVKRIPMIQKLAEDKAAISKCIREGGDLGELAKRRNIVFAHPFTV